jgi:hypothetical protein
MPRLLGENVADSNETIADSLRSVAEGMFRPVDPLTRERLNEADRRRASRANAVEALRRGDMQEYWAQSILANQPGADALEYARQWPGGQAPVASRTTLDLVRAMQPGAQVAPAPTLPALGRDVVPSYAPAATAPPPNPVVLRSPNPTIGPDGNPLPR